MSRPSKSSNSSPARTPVFNLTPYMEAFLKRQAQTSTVAIIKTTDPKRLKPFFLFIKAKKPNSRIFLYKVWSGLFEVGITPDNNIILNPVRMAMTPGAASSPLARRMAAANAQRITRLPAALMFIDNLMMEASDIVFVLWGLFPKKAGADEHDALIAFLRNAIFTEDYYERGHFIVMFSDEPEAIIDETTIEKSIVVDVEPSTEDERRHILMNIARMIGLKAENIDEIVIVTKGLNLHDVESVALESIFRYHRFDIRAMTAYKYDIVRKSGVIDIEEPEHGFEAVGGYDVVKEFIMSNIIKVLRNPKKAEKLGIRPPRGILLFGPPGTGKTWFAKALAKELNLPFLRMRTEAIVSKWYGETSRNMAKVIRIAESIAPAVLFVDEIDRFGQRGQLGEHEESRRAFSILLEWLGDSKRKTIVIGTTNRPEDLDEAFRRVGRFDYMIPFLYPDEDARYEILRVHTSVVRKVPLAKDVDLRVIAKRTNLFSGAEVEEIVIRAARNALNRDADVVTMEDFEDALATFRINVAERQEQIQRYLELAEEFTNDQRFLERLKAVYGFGGDARLKAALSALSNQ